MQFFNFIFLFVAFSFISIEARKGQQYNEMLDPKKGGSAGRSGVSRLKKGKRNYGSSLLGGGDDYDSSLLGGSDSLLNIQAEIETLTSSTINYVDYDQIDCNKDGAKCIRRNTDGVEEQSISIEALIDTSVDCDLDFESGGDYSYSSSNKFLQCITYGSNKVRVTCQSPSNAFIDIIFKGTTNSFLAENGASGRFVKDNEPAGDWETEGVYQSLSAIVEVYCP